MFFIRLAVYVFIRVLFCFSFNPPITLHTQTATHMVFSLLFEFYFDLERKI